MIVDKSYCMSSFLMYRTIIDKNITFADGIIPRPDKEIKNRTPVQNSDDLERAIKKSMEDATIDGKAALALSGGIDSAILAKFMPKGSTAYTFKCVVPGIQVIDETPAAAKYAEECGLEHKVIEIFWEDVEQLAPVLMKHKGAPIHSIEVQIYKAAMQAKKDGYSKLIFGENADILYGGMNGLLEKDWLFGEFVERYSYIMPYKVLKEPRLILEPYFEFEKDGHIDGHDFINKFFRYEALGSYINACSAADVEFVGPYSTTYLSCPINYNRIRAGDTKYIVRELYKKLYRNFEVPQKIPMPRPTNEWLKNWRGPIRNEFLQNCTNNMTGDQKWLVYCLEWFLNLIDTGCFFNNHSADL